MNREPTFKIGDIVIFRGQSDAQRRWGGNDDAEAVLIKGREYTIEGIASHTWHTKLQLRYVEGRFNSVCFGLVGSEL